LGPYFLFGFECKNQPGPTGQPPSSLPLACVAHYCHCRPLVVCLPLLPPIARRLPPRPHVHEALDCLSHHYLEVGHMPPPTSLCLCEPPSATPLSTWDMAALDPIPLPIVHRAEEFAPHAMAAPSKLRWQATLCSYQAMRQNHTNPLKPSVHPFFPENRRACRISAFPHHG
jgi:hypothetical protein